MKQVSGRSQQGVDQILRAIAMLLSPITHQFDLDAAIQGSRSDDWNAVRCYGAIRDIDDFDFAEAAVIGNDVTGSDRLLQSFARVLTYHARKASGESLSVTHDFHLSRLAKRGDRSLREIIGHVEHKRWSDAKMCEMEFFIRVA